MDGAEAAQYIVRAKELRALAETVKSENHRKLLLDSAEKFERLATAALRSERDR